MAAIGDKTSSLCPFHLAIAVDDLVAARHFYHEILGCALGRHSDQWIDFDFFGHQLVTHLAPEAMLTERHGNVDGDAVPVRHFGLVLDRADWEGLAARLRTASWPFLLGPKTRFEGEPGEQSTFFIHDPAGNALEFKTFIDKGQLFAK